MIGQRVLSRPQAATYTRSGGGTISVPTSHLHGAAHPAPSYRLSCGARQGLIAPTFFQDRVRVGADSLIDIVKGGTLRAAAIFDCGTDDAAGIRDEIWNHENAARVQRLLRFEGAWNIGALRHETRAQPRHIVGAHHIGTCGWYPYVAVHIEDCVGRKLRVFVVIPQRLARLLESDQPTNIKAGRIRQCCTCIARGTRLQIVFRAGQKSSSHCC